jgi:hypothetical protein
MSGVRIPSPACALRAAMVVKERRVLPPGSRLRSWRPLFCALYHKLQLVTSGVSCHSSTAPGGGHQCAPARSVSPCLRRWGWRVGRPARGPKLCAAFSPCRQTRSQDTVPLCTNPRLANNSASRLDPRWLTWHSRLRSPIPSTDTFRLGLAALITGSYCP